MKNPIFYSVSFAFLLLVMSFTFSGPVTAHTGHEQTTTVAKYNVLQSNESATYQWYEPSGSSYYQVMNDSEVEVEIADPTNSATKLNLTIGNLTKINITDIDAAGALALGYWNISDYFGFISNTNWTGLTPKIDHQSFVSSSLDTDTSYKFGASTFDAVNISFYDGFQTTNLVYNAETGLLYHAYTSFGNYLLEFEITGYIPVEDSDGTTEETPITIYPLIITLMILIPVFNKFKN